MVRGFIKDKKFHPIRPYTKVRKRRSPSTIDGIKIVKRTNNQEMVNGITKSLQHQPMRVKNQINKIILKDKDPSENFVAKTNTTEGVVVFNNKPELREGDYEALGDHEFEHIDFNSKLESGDRKYEQFIMNGNKIEPFTGDLLMTHEEQEQAFIDGNFGILPDKRLEYPDEINSVITEIETRKKLGLPCDILDEEEFEKAKNLVEELHRKKRDADEVIRKGRWDESQGRYLVVKTKHTDPLKEKYYKETRDQLRKGNFIEVKTIGEAIKAVDEGKGNVIIDSVTEDIIDKSLKKRDVIIGKSNKPDWFFDKKQLQKGMKVELEHTNSPEIAKRIAKDHLEESPRYYIELEKLEKRLGVGND